MFIKCLIISFAFDLQRFYIEYEPNKPTEIKVVISVRKRLERNLAQNILRKPSSKASFHSALELLRFP
nr:MAG TPA: hypothetical protein [Caudoviricetes sp.]